MIRKKVKKLFDFFLKRYGLYYVTELQRKYVRDGQRNSRWYKYAFAECGEHLQIYGNPLIHDPEKIYIGTHFSINNGAQICPRGKIYIGNHVTMSRGSQITAGMMDTSEWIEKRLIGTVSHIENDVYIADGTWLCVNSIVLPGVSIIGKGVIVAAGAVVTKDITDDFVVVAGIPAQIVKRLQKQ